MHDNLVASMGKARVGLVSWRIIRGADRATEALDRMRHPDATEAELETCDKVDALMREHGGYLIIATAPGHPGWRVMHDVERDASTESGDTA